MTRPSRRREMAEKAVAKHEVSIALACRTFGVSETCYRYNPLPSDENEEIADLLLGLTNAKKTWGLGWVSCICAASRVEPVSPLVQGNGEGLEPQKGLSHLLRVGAEPAE